MIEVRMKVVLKVALGCSFLRSGRRTKKSSSHGLRRECVTRAVREWRYLYLDVPVFAQFGFQGWGREPTNYLTYLLRYCMA